MFEDNVRSASHIVRRSNIGFNFDAMFEDNVHSASHIVCRSNI